MNELADSIGWPTRDPKWISKVLIMGLIMLVPVVGQMALLGWMLANLDNLRAGRMELAPANFSHLGRAGHLFTVVLVYGVVLLAAVAILFILGLAIAASSREGNPAGGLFFLLAWALLIVGFVGLYLLTPVVVVATERGGIAGGLNLPAIVRTALANGSTTLFAGLFTLVAQLIGSAGAIVCGVGQILTMAYGYAIIAAIVRYYEQQTGQTVPPAAAWGQ